MKKKKKDRTIVIRTTEEDYRRIKSISSQLNLSMNQYMQHASLSFSYNDSIRLSVIQKTILLIKEIRALGDNCRSELTANTAQKIDKVMSEASSVLKELLR